MSWNYEEHGPDTWCHNYPHAAGHHQSPVDIKTGEAVCDASLKPPQLHYEPKDCKSFFNTGNGCQVAVDSHVLNYSKGDIEYKLAQFHFHWGKTSNEGSEHTVNGSSYAAELHLVHYNSTKYKTAAEALDKPDGLAVIGVLIKAGHQNHHFQKLCDLFSNIRYKSQTVELHDGFDIACLLPHDLHHYWTYAGSLTTPPCHESVTWMVLKEHIEFSEEQLEAFRQLEHVTEHQGATGEHCRCTHNFRPPMPLNDREIKSSL